MIDQGAQFRGRAPGEVPTSDPAQRSEMGFGFAAAEEKIGIPREAIVPLLAVVDVRIPIGFQDNLFFSAIASAVVLGPRPPGWGCWYAAGNASSIAKSKSMGSEKKTPSCLRA